MADAASVDHVAGLLRAADKDRFLADLFVPPDKRPSVMAIHAFSAEIARVREVVSEPMPGEIRLQWWRDAIEGRGHGDVAQHPVGGLLLETLDLHALPRQPLVQLIEARSFDLYDDPMGSVARARGIRRGDRRAVVLAPRADPVSAASETRSTPSRSRGASPTRSPASCAPSPCTPRAGRSTCRSTCCSAMGRSRASS